MSTKRQIGSDGKRQLASDGKQLIADECCCGPGCTTRCYVEFNSTYNCVSAWSSPAIERKYCESPSNVTNTFWTVDPANCLRYLMSVSSGVCCTNDASCSTVSVSTPAIGPGTVRLKPDCETDPTAHACAGCCDGYDVSILSGCAAGTYRITKSMTDCVWGGGTVTPIHVGITMECSCGPCAASNWSIGITTVDNNVTCVNEQCFFEYCSAHPCACFCPDSTSWTFCDQSPNCVGTEHSAPAIVVSAVDDGAGCQWGA